MVITNSISDSACRSLLIAFLFLMLCINTLEPAWVKVTASSVENDDPGLAPENVLDDDISTRWSSKFEDNQWLLIDLGRVKNLYGFQVLWEDAFALQYTIMASKDNQSWTKVYSTSQGNKGIAKIKFKKPRQIRYIKFDLRKRATEWGFSIIDIKLKEKENQDIEFEGYTSLRDSSNWQWKLVWSDEFDGPQIDTSKWNFIVGGGGFGNKEKQFYTDRKENAYIKDGKLVIKVVEEPYKGESYTSAKLTTENKGDWLYGKFEIRARLPEGKGLWPAIWMMPSGYNINYGNWPVCGEIDIMEYLGHDTRTIYGTLHYGEPHTHKGNAYHISKGKSFSEDFHIFTVEWDPDQFRWYCDGNYYGYQSQWFTSSPGADYPAPFDQKFFLQINVAVGGTWPGYPDSTTQLPQYMFVDYVRVYEYDGEYPKYKKPAKDDIKPKRKPLRSGNYIYNGNFSKKDKYWSTATYNGGKAEFKIIKKAMNIQIERSGPDDWSVQLFQEPVMAQKGKTYKVKFDAESDRERTITVGVLLNKEPWTTYSGRRTIKLKPKKKTYSFTYKMRHKTDKQAKLEFNLGREKGDVIIDNVSVKLTDDPVDTAVHIRHNTKIEAEHFDRMHGIQLEDCSDGTQNVGWIDLNDYLEYDIYVSKPGKYKIFFRLAALDNTGSMDILLDNKKQACLSLDSTGDWQNWTTKGAVIKLDKGLHTLKILATGPGFNLSWLLFRKVK